LEAGKVGKMGLIQAYAGDGKGKTTASVGLAVRATGHGLKVGFISFFKDPKLFNYGEYAVLKKLGVEIFVFSRKHPHFFKNVSPDEIRVECLKGLEFVKDLFRDDSWDMLILDEVNIGLRDGFLTEAEVLSLLEMRPGGLELILTGRGLTQGIIDKADLVSKVEKVKHYYDRGVKKRKGIEY
jgi:cob(I)alamin adenosyltransferase